MLGNVGPDEPFGGGGPGDDFDVADPGTTGQILQFRVVPAVAPDPTDPAAVPAAARDRAAAGGGPTRPLALIEEVGDRRGRGGDEVEGPVEALARHR